MRRRKRGCLSGLFPVKSAALKIDPDIIRKEQNYLEEEVKLPYDSTKIFEMITNSGYKHLGFTKNFETMQPRFTFRIDLFKIIICFYQLSCI